MKLCEAISKRIAVLCQEKAIDEAHFASRIAGKHDAVWAVVKGQDPVVPLDIMSIICDSLGVSMFEFFHCSLFEEF